jgi:hypothetical protein
VSEVRLKSGRLGSVLHMLKSALSGNSAVLTKDVHNRSSIGYGECANERGALDGKYCCVCWQSIG